MAGVSPVRPAQARPVIYLGGFREEDDRAFKAFREQLAIRHPALRTALLHVYTPGGDQEVARSEVILRAHAMGPRVLVAPTGTSAAAARVAAALGTPVVFASYLDPVRLTRATPPAVGRLPMTGVSLADLLALKRLELLRDAVPSAREVGVLADAAWFRQPEVLDPMLGHARRLGMNLRPIVVDELDALSLVMHREDVLALQAWYVPVSFLSYQHEAAIIEHIRRQRLPAIHGTVEEVRAGATMAYAQDTSFALPAMADLVARVCAGEAAGEIPVETPRRFVLAIRRDASERGVRLPPALIRRADLLV